MLRRRPVIKHSSQLAIYTKILSITSTKEGSIRMRVSASFFDENYNLTAGYVKIEIAEAVTWI
jgi:hypothetical protein